RDELEEIKPQFIKFLALNGYDSSSWEKVKQDDLTQANQLIDQFSQIVFSGVIDRMEYLIQRSNKDIRTYHCLPGKIRMLGLLVEGETNLDLRQVDLPAQEMMKQVRQSGAAVKLYSGERAYRAGDRQRDVFLLMEQGALISDGELFSILEEVSKA
ncbi:MAG: DUF6495 family protein, partial [Bacteroidota bacterium]